MTKITNLDENYSAVVVEVKSLIELDGLDNLVGFPIMGMQALVSRDVKVGDIGIVFPTECQLSEDFCYNNNLYRHSNLNKDTEASGYIEDKRRIKALKLRKNTSNALFMPLSSLDYLGDLNLNIGDSFTHIDGHEVCKKYELKIPTKKERSQQLPKKKRVDNKLLPEHDKTPNFFRVQEDWLDDDYVYVTTKLHGTSFRLGHTCIDRDLSWWEKLAIKFGFKINTKEYKVFAGSRRVIKYDDNQGDHYYDTNIYLQNKYRYQHLVPKNWILYGELIGWAGDSPIQKNYTYQIQKGEFDTYVYRISVINNDGIRVDLHWDQVKQWCELNGIKHVPELCRGYFKDFNLEQFKNTSYAKMGYDTPPLDKKSPCDEGIVLMKYGLTEKFAKVKSSDFLAHETKQIDSGQVDMESEN